MKIWSIPKTRVLLPTIAGLALMGLSGAALAKPGGGQPGGEGPRGGGLCAKLECTDQQKEALRAVVTELRADTKADREAIRRLKKDLAAEFAKAKPSEAAMKKITAEIATHEQELRERVLDAMMEVHALLDAEQRAKLAQAMERRGLRALMRGGKGHGPGQGKGQGKGDGKGKARPQAAG